MEEAGSEGKFVIDWATGQISVAKGAKFNVTTDDDINDSDNNAIDADSYDVTVVATDPKGIPNEVVIAKRMTERRSCQRHRRGEDHSH